MSAVPEIRVGTRNKVPVDAAGDYVLYWMIAARRTTWNFGLERALGWARELRKPLLVFEGLRADAHWASDRLHRFVLDGMADNARRLERAGVRYFPYVEPERGAGKGLLEALAARACVVVTDEFPCFFLPRMVEAAAGKLRARLETVDSNGLLPLAAAPKEFPSAYAFRRFLQKNLRGHLDAFPQADPLRGVRLSGEIVLPREFASRWPRASEVLLRGDTAALARLPIDHTVPPVAVPGGSAAADRTLRRFLEILPRYEAEHSSPEAEVTSGLSPYLHFGHIAAHAVFHAVALQESWTPADLARKATGKREGWWGMSVSAEAFLDELVTWRELGYIFCARRPDYESYESLPDWARGTLDAHESDRRDPVYELDAFESAATHDPLWNAAQNQLLREGRIHNYLRMLWGKKILEWSRNPRRALEILIELNNKWALDGRNPNSYSGVGWVLGRFDRPWGPERPIFGTVRYMSSDNTARKFRVKEYIRRYSEPEPGPGA